MVTAVLPSLIGVGFAQAFGIQSAQLFPVTVNSLSAIVIPMRSIRGFKRSVPTGGENPAGLVRVAITVFGPFSSAAGMPVLRISGFISVSCPLN